jgi:hypothetical protein
MKKLVVIAGVWVLVSAPAFAVPYHSTASSLLCEIHCGENKEAQVEGPDFGTNDVSAVPLPAAGWMLLAGLGGLVAMRRRARA